MAMRVITARVTSYSLSGKDDDQAKNKAADQDQRGRRGQVTIAEPFLTPIESQRHQHSNDDDTQKKQQPPRAEPGAKYGSERYHDGDQNDKFQRDHPCVHAV